MRKIKNSNATRIRMRIYAFGKKTAYSFPLLIPPFRIVLTGFQLVKKTVSLFLVMIPIIGAHCREKIIEDLSRHKEIRFLLNSLFANSEAANIYIASLPTNDLLNRKQVLLRLVKLQEMRVRESIDANKKTVAICFPTLGYRAHVGNIATKLRMHGYNVVTLLGEIGGDDYEQPKGYFYIPNDMLSDVDFVDLFISTQIGPFDHIQVSGKVVHFFHDIHDSALPDIESHFRILLGVDYFFLSSRFLAERLKHLITVGKQKFLMGGENGKKTCLITGGYPKLDSNLEYFKKHKNKASALIYAPTMPPGKWMKEMEGLVATPQHSDNIIKAILDNFKEYDLIFRPHPHSINFTEIQNIAKKFSNHPRFIFDDNVDFYMDGYTKSALMLTDMSGTAYTYAFTTLRPTVFFSHNETEVMRIFGTYRYFIDRSKVGVIAQSIGELLDKISRLLLTKNEYRSKIREYRNSTIYNIGTSEDYFVENVEDILNNKVNSDWIYL